MKRHIVLYTCAVFLSAFLLFQVQPIVARALLPAFGGSYLVWGTCMAFFQGLLLLGYAWAHQGQRLAGVVGYSRWHVLLLLAPLAFAPFRFGRLTGPSSDGTLFADVIMQLLVTVGLPFFTLSTASLLLQRWLSISDLPQRAQPYALYSASNLGSLLALLSYPVLIEPLMALQLQNKAWWAAYGLLVILMLFCIPRSKDRTEEKKELEAGTGGARVSGRQLATWLLLSSAGSVMLIAVSNVITFDVASVPFLWVLPLSVYLLTFVLLFKRVPWSPAWTVTMFPWVIVVAAMLYLIPIMRLTLPMWASLPLQLAVLFFVCLRVHALLVESRPADHRQLTTFYVTMSAGGFLGSLLVSGLLPVTSTSLIEYPGGLLLAALAVAMGSAGEGGWKAVVKLDRTAVGASAGVLLALVAIPLGLQAAGGVPAEAAAAIVAVPLMFGLRAASREPARLLVPLVLFASLADFAGERAFGAERIHRLRNYYGVYKIFERDNIRYLQHGTTLHGREYVSGPKVGVPLSYFHPSTPAGELLSRNDFQGKRVGMIGLGTGALVALMGEGQHMTLYELDPDNGPIAEKNFTYMATARKKGAKLDFVYGDGRINLKGVQDGTYDIFILDAFSSGSIPVHLLTTEAVKQYLRVVKPGGLVLMHISNKFLDLEPIVWSVGHAAGGKVAIKNNAGSINPDADYTVWAAITRDSAVHDKLVHHLLWRGTPLEKDALPKPWTDEYSNLFGVLLH